jgi:hypothetical protein
MAARGTRQARRVLAAALGAGSLTFVFSAPAHAVLDFTEASGSPVSVGGTAVEVVSGNFNGDGTQDLAVALSDSNQVAVLLGNGAGGFFPAPGSPFAATGDGSDRTAGIAAEDMDGDFDKDLAVALNDSGNLSKVSVLLNDGTGSFTLAGAPAVVNTQCAIDLATAQLNDNEDSIPDVVMPSICDDNFVVLYGDGTGNFTANGDDYDDTGGTQPSSVAVKDLNLDGDQDLIFGHASSDDVTVFFGNGASPLTFPLTPSWTTGVAGSRIRDVGTVFAVTIGVYDIVAAAELSDGVGLLLNNGSDQWLPAGASPFGTGGGGANRPVSLVTGDITAASAD